MNSMLPGSVEHIPGDTGRGGQIERRQARRSTDTPTFDQHIAAFFPYPRGNPESLAATSGTITERRLSATTSAAKMQRRRQGRDG